MRRFYKKAEAVGCKVLLDGRELKTPARALLLLPNSELAGALAEEWQAQGEKIDNSRMYLTQIAMTAIDRVAGNRDKIITELRRYLNTDLLCYRAPSPQDLIALQEAEWQPLIDWFQSQYGLKIATTQGLSPIVQSPGIERFFLNALEKTDDLRLTILQISTLGLGSLLLAFAFLQGYINAERAVELSFLDEDYQARLWGEDPETTRRQKELKAEMAAGGRFLALMNGAPCRI